MAETGWKVRVVSDREVEPEGVNADQAAVYRQALDACTESYEQMYPPAPITTETVRDLYRQELATMACLQKLGIQGETPPSEQAYIDEYLAHGFSTWFAYANVNAQSSVPLPEVEKKCPQPELKATS